MKKSKFLQSSKDMLTRSFNPAKCKTSLRLAGSRLKLLRNKKDAQVKQMRKEIAQLLESGQDRTARIRVEHVIREEKLMAAYDLLEIYCELIVARLPIIESQKNCPIDLKESIASLIFASPRCGDVPELLDARKQFTAKYGKDFTTAAIELRPQCGVGRMLVEKLSAMAPDGQTKIKILSVIAEEHNVKWDPLSYEEEHSVPPSDLLSGPSNFGEESKAHIEPPRFEAADVQARPGNNKLHNSPLNFSLQNPRTSAGAEKLASVQTSGVNMTCQPEVRPPGHERAQLFQGESYSSSPDRQRWNVEFKDATSAAQAAAESAELASMAARAAAELSSHGRIMRQYSTESHKSDIYISKDEGHEMPLNSKFSREQFSEESLNISSSEHTRLQREQMKPNNPKTATRFGDVHGSSEEYSTSASLKSKASIDNDAVGHGVPVVDQYSKKNSLKEVSRVEMGMEKQSFKHEAETANSWPEESGNFLEERTQKQQSVSSSRSHSSVSDDVNIFANSEDLKLENDASENPFMNIGKGSIHGEASQTSSHEYAAAVFDRFDSDTDDHGFDTGPTYDEPDSELHLPSLSQRSPEHLSEHTDSWLPGSNSNKVVRPTSPPLFFTRENSPPHFSENLTLRDDAELDNSAPVTFDESDGATSESDEDIDNRHLGLEDSRDPLRKDNERGQSVGSEFKHKTRQSVRSPFKDETHSAFDREQLSVSSDHKWESDKMHLGSNKTQKFDTDSPEKLSLMMPAAEQPPLGPEDSHMESKDGYDSSPKSEERLNFGKLTGGLRHKGYNKLPFLKNQLDVSSSVKKETETTASTTNSTTPSAVEDLKISSMLDNKKSTRTPDPHSESDSDSSEEEEYLQKSSGNKQEIYTPIAEKEAKTKSSLGASNSIFGSDSSDLDEDPLKRPLTWKSRPQGGISRRTKATPSPGTTSHSKTPPRAETLNSNAGMDRKPTISYSSETQKNSETQKRNSGKLENYEQPNSEKVNPMPAKSKIWGPPKQHNSAKETTVVMQESKVKLSSEARDSDANLGRKPSNSYSPDTSLTRNSSQLGNSGQPTPAKVASKPTNSKFSGSPDRPISGKAIATTMQENKISRKSSAVEETSSPQQEPEASVSRRSPEKEPMNKTSLNKDDGVKKASHVHPKLPDYDTLFASLRKNRS